MLKQEVYLRPLEVEDALISYKWRNNSIVWKYTGSMPDRIITKKIELDWINKVLLRQNEKRFSICLSKTNVYIGNVQLTNINYDSAEFHIFIGEPKYWGKKLGYIATKLMLDIGVNELNLKEIYLYVSKKNIPAIKMYLNCNFSIAETDDTKYKMIYKSSYI